jgi:hypothetical protein
LAGTLMLSALSSGCSDAAGDTQAVELSLRSAVKREVDGTRELLITDASVVASPVETTFDARHASGSSPKGAWSFGRLIHNMLPSSQRQSREAASRFTMAWLHTWEEDQSPNPSVSPAKARSTIRLQVIGPWKAASGCAEPASPETDAGCVLDMAKAPFRLMSIVNRPDLRIVSNDGSAIGGEGRFVFQLVGPTLGVNAATSQTEVMDPTVKPQKFTVIFEYSLPVREAAGALEWAKRWHALGAMPFGSGYNAALRALTNDFSGPDRDLRRPNGNALNQLRTNEVALQGARFPAAGFVAGKQFWELREFHLAPEGFSPHTTNLEPARDFDVPKTGQTSLEGLRSAELASFLMAGSEAVLASKHRLPDGMSANSALVGGAPYGAWGKLVNPNPPTIPAQGVEHALGADVPIAVRDSFALNTCAGCHRHETDTRHFMHITLLGAMEPADKVDDRTRVGVPADAPDDTVVLSNFMRAEVSPGGARFEDFSTLLSMKPRDLRNVAGMRMCAR